MKKQGVFLCFLFLLIVFPLISAAPPVTTIQQFSEGYVILDSPQETLTKGADYNYNFFLYNLSNGVQLDNSSVSCIHYIANSFGELISYNNISYILPQGYWNLVIDKGNFSETGIYSYGTKCIGNLGGSITGLWEVTPTGKILDITESLLYFLLVLIISGMLILTLYFMITTPYSNTLNEKGAVIQVTKSKYVKLFLIMLSYLLFVWLLNILIGISDNYITLTMFYGFLSFLFLLLNKLSLPFIIFIIVLALFEIVRDSNISSEIKKWGTTK